MQENLSAFEEALLKKPSSQTYKPKVARIIAVLTVLLFSTLYAPVAQTRETELDPESLLTVLNQDRARFGLDPLAADNKLRIAAEAKAHDILANGYFAHTAPNGTEPWDFIKNTGFKYSFAGENLAINYTSSFELHNDFMDSVHHRENLLSPLFSNIGIAVVKGKFQDKEAVVTVQMFASKADQLAVSTPAQGHLE